MDRKRTLLNKISVIIIIILFISITFSTEINANVNKPLKKCSSEHQRLLFEKEIFDENVIKSNRSRYDRYMTEDGELKTIKRNGYDVFSEIPYEYEIIDMGSTQSVLDYSNHSPIYIKGNDNFTSENGVTSGSGTENDPFIIENWIIDGKNTIDNGIFIEKTDAYFIIRNCSITGFRNVFGSGGPMVGNGILLNKVNHGKIIDVECFNNWDGIACIESSYIDIINCSCHHNIGENANGIETIESRYINIISTQCYGMRSPSPNYIPHGISNWGSSYCLIEDCEVYDNKGSGIFFKDWGKNDPNEYNVVKNCNIHNNTWFGLEFTSDPGMGQFFGGYNTIIDCEIHNNDIGIHIQNLPHTTIENCTVHHHDDGSGWVKSGIQLHICSNSIVKNCTLYDNEDGVWIMGALLFGQISFGNKVEHCDIYNNQYDGISVGNPFPAKISYNNIYNNGHYGILVYPVLFSTAKIHNNNIYNNGIAPDWEWPAGLTVVKSIVNAKNNWWGTAMGPSTRFFKNRGDAIFLILGFCLFRPWAKEPFDDAGVQI